MCEQEWVVNRIFRICETKDLESFNVQHLRPNSIVGLNIFFFILTHQKEEIKFSFHKALIASFKTIFFFEKSVIKKSLALIMFFT